MTQALQTGFGRSKIERENDRERNEGIFRKRGSNFSLNFPAIGPSISGEVRSKVALRYEGYAWAPVFLEFRQTPEGRGVLLLDLILV